MQIKIVFENEHFLAVDKPSGLLSVPSSFSQDDPRPVLGRILEEQTNWKLFPIHRLDMEASGIMLWARSLQAQTVASRWFEERSVSKNYQALTEGKADELSPGKKFCWESKILKGKKRAFEDPNGKMAVTYATFLAIRIFQGQQVLLWDLQPMTGRFHQLRFELVRHGFPILGDERYGATLPFEPNAIALRASELDLSRCEKASKWGLPSKLKVESFTLFRAHS